METFLITVPVTVEIKANCEENAMLIIEESEFKVSGPLHTKHGVYYIKKVTIDDTPED